MLIIDIHDHFSKNCLVLASFSLIFLIADKLSPVEHGISYFNIAEAGEVACINYDETENTIAVNCDSSFVDVVQMINDPEVIENLGNGEYLLKANLEVNDGVTFAMTSSKDGLQYLKIADANGIIIYGKIQIDGIKITS